MTYYLIDKRYEELRVFEDNEVDRLGTRLLGRSMSDFVIIKSNENGDRKFNSNDNDVFAIEKALKDF